MLIEVSIGEVVDKYTILLIKQKHITDAAKLKNVNTELSYLAKVLKTTLPTVTDETKKLMEINQALWDIEDEIRIKESKSEFDEVFIKLARSVYFTNDERARVKHAINVKCKSQFVEEKQYQKYN